MALYKAYAGTTGDSIDLSGVREITLNASEQIDNTYSDGVVIVRPFFSTSAYGKTYCVHATVTDNAGVIGSGDFYVKMDDSNYKGYRPSFYISVPSSFDVTSDTLTVTLKDTTTSSTKIFLRGGDHYADAAYYLPTAPLPPDTIAIFPTSCASGQKAKIAWNEAQAGIRNPVNGYKLYKSNDNVNYSFFADVSACTYLVDSGSSNGQKDYYKVMATGTFSGLDSALSDATVILTTEWSAPAPPTYLTLSTTAARPSSDVTLSFSGAQDGLNNPIAKYQVYRSIDGNTYTVLLDCQGTSCTVLSPDANNTAYYYKVKAIGILSDVDSTLSAPICLTTHYTPVSTPGTPPVLSANYVPPGTGVTLSWPASSNGSNNDVTAYCVYKAPNNGVFTQLLVTTATSCTVQPPEQNATMYAYRVQACGQYPGGDSEQSVQSEWLHCLFDAPTTPQDVTIDGKTRVYLDANVQATLTWEPASGGMNNPLTGYRVYRNNQEIAFTNTTACAINASNVEGQTLSFTVKAQGQWSLSGESNPVLVSTNISPVPPRSNKKVTSFMFFDRNDVLQFIREDAITLHVVEEELKCSGSFPYCVDKVITSGMRIGWLEDSEMLLYEIRQPVTNAVTMIQSFEAEHIAIAELTDAIIEDMRPQNKTASQACAQALAGTQWNVGTVTADESIGTTNFYYSSVWAALLNIRDTWGVTVRPRLAYTYNGVQRYIDILSRLGQNRGVRLTLTMNAQQAGITYDDRKLFTALYGRGASAGEGQRLTTFASAVWTKADGDPADKPEGQEWVEDTDASARWGRKGEKRTGIVTFNNITDANELLAATWDALQKCNAPAITISMTAFNLETLGYSAQGVALGDDITVVLDPIGLELQSRVTQYDRDVLRPENSKPTIGTYRSDIVFKLSGNDQKQGVATVVSSGLYSFTISQDYSLLLRYTDSEVPPGYAINDMGELTYTTLGAIPQLHIDANGCLLLTT